MKNEKIKTAAGLGLFISSFFLIVAGIANSEVATVFNKAIKICMECIGIG